MKLLSILIVALSTTAPAIYAETIWDATQASSGCTYNQTLGSSGRCAPLDASRTYESPLTPYGKTLPAYFNYTLSVHYNFSCKREVGTTPLATELALVDAGNGATLSRLKLAPTLSVEQRTVAAKVKSNSIRVDIRILPTMTSTFYGPCLFELKEVELTPDLDAISSYADELIERHEFGNNVEQTLADALSKPKGWERAEQLPADLSGYAQLKVTECKRDVRQLSRKLKISIDYLQAQDKQDILNLSGYEVSGLPFTVDQIANSEGLCSGKNQLTIGGKIGAGITDYLSLKDAEEKSRIFASFNECHSQVSEICRNSVETFRAGILKSYREKGDKAETSFVAYLQAEYSRLKEHQKALQEQLKEIADEITSL